MRGEYTQNVPLSVNYATAPAITLNDRVYFGMSSVSEILPTFSKKGIITLYNIARFLKVSIIKEQYEYSVCYREIKSVISL